MQEEYKLMANEYELDVALSFAGENRDYVRAVARELVSLDIRVFFDEYEQVFMWGKDLYENLHEVYSKKARYNDSISVTAPSKSAAAGRVDRFAPTFLFQ